MTDPKFPTTATTAALSTGAVDPLNAHSTRQSVERSFEIVQMLSPPNLRQNVAKLLFSVRGERGHEVCEKFSLLGDLRW